MLDQKRLRELFDYDHNTGHLIRKIAPRGTRVGSIAGYVESHGGRSITISRARYQAARLVWMYHHGEFPKAFIDHKNGDRDDNRIENLRECTPAENAQNKIGKVGETRFLGVTRVKNRPGYHSRITLGGRKIYLGYFRSPEDAHAAYLKAKSELHHFQPVPRNVLITAQSEQKEEQPRCNVSVSA